MRSGIVALMLAIFPAFGQLDLATTRDGSLLYFSAVPQNCSSYNIYRWSQETGVTLFAEGAESSTGVPYRLWGTQITIDGAVLYHDEPACPILGGASGNHCSSGETIIAIPQTERFRVPNYLLMSPSGRFGVFFDPRQTRAFWVDWWTGEEIQVELGPLGFGVPGVVPGIGAGQHVVADDGSFLTGAPGGLKVWSKSGERLLPLRYSPLHATISTDGSTVAVDPNSYYPGSIHHLPSGQEWVARLRVSMSDDGKTLATLTADPTVPPFSKAQALVTSADGSRARQVGNSPEGVRGVLLSGDGRVLYAIAQNFDYQKGVVGRAHILRYDLETGATEDIFVP